MQNDHNILHCIGHLLLVSYSFAFVTTISKIISLLFVRIGLSMSHIHHHLNTVFYGAEIHTFVHIDIKLGPFKNMKKNPDYSHDQLHVAFSWAKSFGKLWTLWCLYSSYPYFTSIYPYKLEQKMGSKLVPCRFSLRTL